MDASTDLRTELRTEIDEAAVGLVSKIERLENQAAQLRVQLKNSVSLDHHMQTHPWSVFGVAFAGGLMLGILTK